MSRLSKNLQITNLRRVFTELNPMSDPALIDWDHVVDETLCYEEQLENLKEEYPEFRWTMRDDYDAYYKDYLGEEAARMGLNLTRYDATKKIGRLEKENGKLKNRQENLVKESTQISEAEALKRVYGVPPVVLDDLRLKTLVVAGEPGNGKSTIVKVITEAAMRRGYEVKCFDISLAWYHNSPLKHRVSVRDWGSPRNEANTLYDMAPLTSQDRRNLVSRMIYEDWAPRYDYMLDNPNAVESMPRKLIILEEGNTFLDASSLNRKDWTAQVFQDFISTRRNYGLDMIIVATRVSGEISPKIRNRCNYLASRLMGKEERNYIERSTSREFVDKALKLPRYKFVYSGSEQVLTPFGVEPPVFGSPEDLQPWMPDPPLIRQPRQPGFWGKLRALI